MMKPLPPRSGRPDPSRKPALITDEQMVADADGGRLLNLGDITQEEYEDCLDHNPELLPCGQCGPRVRMAKREEEQRNSILFAALGEHLQKGARLESYWSGQVVIVTGHTSRLAKVLAANSGRWAPLNWLTRALPGGKRRRITLTVSDNGILQTSATRC